MNILHLDSSILGPYPVNRGLSAKVVERLQSAGSNATVVYRDLAANPVPHLSGAYLAALQKTEGQTSDVAADLLTGGDRGARRLGGNLT